MKRELQEDKLSNDIERFIQRGGFPEPFLAEDEVESKASIAHDIKALPTRVNIKRQFIN